MSEKSESPTSSPPQDDLHNDIVPETSESPTSPPPKPQLHNSSGTPDSPASPPLKSQLHNNTDLLSEIVLWRRKQVNIVILAAATATWVVMDVYDYNFITLLSWLAIALLACLFFWGTIHTFLKKEAPDLSELEISEETAMEQARLLRRGAEEVIRLMFHVSSEREWFVFVGAVGCLYLIALAAQHLDFVTLCLIGIVGAMSVPFAYVKNEQRIWKFAEDLRMRSQRLNLRVEEKFQKMKSKIRAKTREIKEKKTK